MSEIIKRAVQTPLQRSSNLSAETAQILLDAMTFSDKEGEEPYFHDEIVWADDTPDGNDHSIDAVRYAMLDDMLRG